MASSFSAATHASSPFSIHIFTPSKLNSDEGVHQALQSIQIALQSAPDYQGKALEIVDFFLSIPNLLQFIISGTRIPGLKRDQSR